MPDASEGDREFHLAAAAIDSFDVDAAMAHLSASIRAFTSAGLPCRAAMACVRLGDLLANFMGNLTAARAWFARAARLVADEPDCLEQGWVAVAAMGCDVDDPVDLLARAELALDRARRFGDVNLETKALADAGLAHVQAGRIAHGMTLLDEAMALACGAADDLDAASKSVCSFFTACYYAADFERAGSWALTLRDRGFIGLSPGPAVFLSNHCDSVQAALLCELGRWSEAEALLSRAIEEFEEAMPVSSWHPAIELAELRVRQGRFADAEALLLGKDGHLQALLPVARLNLARGDLDLARATARRGLRAIGDDRLRAAELLAVLVETELLAGDHAAAIEAAAELAARTKGLELVGLQARTALVQTQVLAATDALPEAMATIQAAVDDLAGSVPAWLHVKLLIGLARARDDLGDRAAALVEAKAAAALVDTLDVVLSADDLALIARLAADVASPGHGRAAPTATLATDGRWWIAMHATTRVRLADSKGLRYLAELLARPGVERHVLDLVDRIEGIQCAGGVDRHHLGDAGEVIDSQARVAYRRRIEVLRAEIDDALAGGSEGEAEAQQDELDQLVGQLAQAFGLGGRGRRASSTAERARLNVTRALRAAIAKLAEALPEAGTALAGQVRTGLYCVYEMADEDDVRWCVQS